MNKKLIGLVTLFSFLFLASFALGQITNPGPADFPTLLKNIADVVGTLISSVSVIMIIIAGIFYLTSAGSPERIGVAKKTLIYAIAGIVIGLAAQSIADMVVGFMT